MFSEWAKPFALAVDYVPVSRWVPIREGPDTSPPLPFDFAGDRVIMVPRKAETVDKTAFADAFRKTVKEVIDDLDIV